MLEGCGCEKGLTVTFFAVREGAAVNVVFLVTDHALLTYPTEVTVVAMAFGAAEQEVNALQPEIAVVITGAIPVSLVVAVRAFLAKAAIVRVLVAGFAVLARYAINDELVFGAAWWRFKVIAGLCMTFCTLNFVVLAFELEVGNRVIKEEFVIPDLGAVAVRAGHRYKLGMKLFLMLTFMAAFAVTLCFFKLKVVRNFGGLGV